MTTRNRKQEDRKESFETKPPSLIAYHVSERGENKFWTRIGAAWDHLDAKGLTLQLEMLPVNGGRIVLRQPLEDDPQMVEEEEGV